MSYSGKLKNVLLAVGLLAGSQAYAQILSVGMRAGPESMDPHTIQFITGGPAPTLPNDLVRLRTDDETLAMDVVPAR